MTLLISLILFGALCFAFGWASAVPSKEHQQTFWSPFDE